MPPENRKFPRDDISRLRLVKNTICADSDNEDMMYLNNIKLRKFSILNEIHKKQKEIYKLLEELKSLGGR